MEGAQIAAEKLRKQVEAHPFHADGREIRLTASFGVAELNQSPAAGYYRMVDQALYQAKKKGRNRVEVLRQEAPREPDFQAAAP
jgi:diguanylate cyclase (GGDEF)-like protein